MVTVTRRVDQWVLIGQDIVVGPTDIDDRTSRVIARGRMLGGANDGGTFQSAHELARGQSFAIGPCIIVTMLEIKGDHVRLAVHAPRHLGVCRKEAVGNQETKGNDVG